MGKSHTYVPRIERRKYGAYGKEVVELGERHNAAALGGCFGRR